MTRQVDEKSDTKSNNESEVGRDNYSIIFYIKLYMFKAKVQNIFGFKAYFKMF